jgi:hypothetical protein
MNTKSKLIVAVTFGATAAVAAPALAQEQATTPYFQQSLAAPQNAFELSVAPIYAQPYGDFSKGADMREAANSGAGVVVGAGYRLAPRFMVGLTGGYNEFATGSPGGPLAVTSRSRAFTAGVEGVFHTRPYDRVDPFFSLGTGWRGMWELHDGPSNDVFRHGLSLVRAGLGIDFRVSRDVAIAPVVAGDLNVFLWQNNQAGGGTTTIADPRVGLFLNAGVQGRFDLAGERVTRGGEASTTTTTSAPLPEMPPEPVITTTPITTTPPPPAPTMMPVEPRTPPDPRTPEERLPNEPNQMEPRMR